LIPCAIDRSTWPAISGPLKFDWLKVGSEPTRSTPARPAHGESPRTPAPEPHPRPLVQAAATRMPGQCWSAKFWRQQPLDHPPDHRRRLGTRGSPRECSRPTSGGETMRARCCAVEIVEVSDAIARGVFSTACRTRARPTQSLGEKAAISASLIGRRERPFRARFACGRKSSPTTSSRGREYRPHPWQKVHARARTPPGYTKTSSNSGARSKQRLVGRTRTTSVNWYHLAKSGISGAKQYARWDTYWTQRANCQVISMDANTLTGLSGIGRGRRRRLILGRLFGLAGRSGGQPQGCRRPLTDDPVKFGHELLG
jgi:hypothetical protein